MAETKTNRVRVQERDKKYQAILIDPPWHFKTYDGKNAVPGRSREGGEVVDPYKTMTLDEIADLPIEDLAAKDCLIFLWKSDPLPYAPAILATTWGFRIVTDNVFIWVKPSIGFGYWTRKRSESLTLLKRGSPRRLSASVDQLIIEKRREHSRKPDEIYSRIEQLVGGPYLELFARQAVPGWDQWGDETSKFAPDPSQLKIKGII